MGKIEKEIMKLELGRASVRCLEVALCSVFVLLGLSVCLDYQGRELRVHGGVFTASE